MRFNNTARNATCLSLAGILTAPDTGLSRFLRQAFPKSRLWVFDEIHKYRRWRNYLKGIYDAREAGQQLLITGSARLDYYRFGGDSLSF